MARPYRQTCIRWATKEKYVEYSVAVRASGESQQEFVLKAIAMRVEYMSLLDKYRIVDSDVKVAAEVEGVPVEEFIRRAVMERTSQYVEEGGDLEGGDLEGAPAKDSLEFPLPDGQTQPFGFDPASV